MAKTKTVFYCTNCGNETPKWMGRCPSCGAYNTMEEHVEKPVAAGKAKSAPVGMSRKPQRIREITSDGEIRFSTGMGELDRVLGGGAVAGSLVLVGGAPGIGKSTLLLQICSSLCVGRRVPMSRALAEVVRVTSPCITRSWSASTSVSASTSSRTMRAISSVWSSAVFCWPLRSKSRISNTLVSTDSNRRIINKGCIPQGSFLTWLFWFSFSIA